MTEDVTASLTPDQEDALREVMDRVRSGRANTKLNGRAGVGKTYVTARLVRALLQEELSPVVVTAPTHEATNQLRQALPADVVGRVELSTLHSALDLTMTWKQDRQVLTKRGNWDPVQPRVLLVDEASMIGEQLQEHVEDMRQKSDTSVVWIGDDAQLPPVNQKSAGVLGHPGPTLTEIVRQAEGSAIIRAAATARSGNNGWVEEVLNHVDGKEVHVKENCLDEIADKFRSSSELYGARVVAFRNATVSKWNRSISGRLFPSAEEWEAGMRAMARETWLGPEDEMGPLHTSEMYEVLRADLQVEEIGHVGPVPGIELDTWHLELDPAHRKQTVQARVLDSASEKAYAKEKERRLQACRSDRMPWQAFYGLVEDVADVGYGYASTVHKAQGATITDVFCDYGDIVSAPGGEHQIQPLAYVAITRASESFTFCV